MDVKSLDTPLVKGILFGAVVLVLMVLFRIPPGASAAAGILFGFVAFVVEKDAIRSNRTER